MFETLLRLYKEGKINITKLDNAIEKGWITTAQKQQILGAE